MKAYVFPGQGSQFPGMGKDLYEQNAECKALFDKADSILGFSLSDIMFNGEKEDLKQTGVTQPAIFVHSIAVLQTIPDFSPAMVAGHSLGEFSALVAAKVLSFEDGLSLVYKRAMAMQEACEIQASTMAAVLALEDNVVEQICEDVDGVVVPANYNCPGQLVISGEVDAVNLACDKLKEAGARRALLLPVGGAFHSPLMNSAKSKLEKAILEAEFSEPICHIYQNVDAQPSKNVNEIKQKLIDQLTSPVRWTQIVQNMISAGAINFTEVGPGKVLTGLARKIDVDKKVMSFTSV